MINQCDFTIDKIDNIYICEYDDNVYCLFAHEGDTGYYSLNYLSSYIKSIYTTNLWYLINIDNITTTFTSTSSKDNDGNMYIKQLVLQIENTEKQKYIDLINILKKRYIIVIENDGNYFCFGNNNPSIVSSYSIEDMRYKIIFTSKEKQELSQIDNTFVINNIINQ